MFSTGAIIPLKQVYDYYKKQEEKYNWGDKVRDMGTVGDAYSGANYYYQQKREAATQYAEKHNVEKPGGTLEKHTDIVTDWWNKAAHHVQGKAYGTAGLEDSGDGGGSSLDSIKEPGSRATIAGKGRTGGEFDEDTRRGLQAYNTKTLLTQGKKAKQLS